MATEATAGGAAAPAVLLTCLRSFIFLLRFHPIAYLADNRRQRRQRHRAAAETAVGAAAGAAAVADTAHALVVTAVHVIFCHAFHNCLWEPCDIVVSSSWFFAPNATASATQSRRPLEPPMVGQCVRIPGNNLHGSFCCR